MHPRLATVFALSLPLFEVQCAQQPPEQRALGTGLPLTQQTDLGPDDSLRPIELFGRGTPGEGVTLIFQQISAAGPLTATLDTMSRTQAQGDSTFRLLLALEEQGKIQLTLQGDSIFIPLWLNFVRAGDTLSYRGPYTLSLPRSATQFKGLSKADTSFKNLRLFHYQHYQAPGKTWPGRWVDITTYLDDTIGQDDMKSPFVQVLDLRGREEVTQEKEARIDSLMGQVPPGPVTTAWSQYQMTHTPAALAGFCDVVGDQRATPLPNQYPPYGKNLTGALQAWCRSLLFTLSRP